MAGHPTKDEIRNREIPDIIYDAKHSKKYKKGRFLGKGGFAKCYELTDMATQEIFAGKVVSKALLVKPSQKEKMTQEISIHRSLSHPCIVGFQGYFEDNENIYILLELCRRRSLMELHKRRQCVSELEARYFLRQLVLGCIYIQKERVIHRDLKLGNIFLNDELQLKIGDFGLATRLGHDSERKKTLCGTPNYIAPEVLTKKGHGFQVDIWSIGCILYTLLVGRPPFETSSLKDTYGRIRRNEYTIPMKVSQPARKLISRLLKADPSERPLITSLLDDDFFKGYIPSSLPVSALSTQPRFDTLFPGVGIPASSLGGRRPLGELNPSEDHPISSGGPLVGGEVEKDPNDYWLTDLHKQVSQLLLQARSLPDEAGLKSMEDAEDPACVPVYWVSKWVDYSDKYGLGYQLCDNSVGVLFNDSTRMLLTANEHNLQYIEADGKEHLHTTDQHPVQLDKKATLLNYFKEYMHEYLLKAGENMARREADDMARLPFLRTWFRTKTAIVLHLSNGTLQLNFFEDHTKIILCPLMTAATYIDASKEFKTYRFSLLQKQGMLTQVARRLTYAKAMIERMLPGKDAKPITGSGGDADKK